MSHTKEPNTKFYTDHEMMQACYGRDKQIHELVVQKAELLEACKHLLGLVCKMCIDKNPHHKECTSCKDTDGTRQAIAKAEGI